MRHPLGIGKRKAIVTSQPYNFRGFSESWIPIVVLCTMSKQITTGHAFNSKHLFLNFPISKLKMTDELAKKAYANGLKRNLAGSIFMKSVELVVNDIIENNVHFKLPTLGRTLAYMYVNRLTGDRFKRAFRNGKWRDVDFIQSDFTGYQLCFEMKSKKRTNRIKPVYLSKNYKLKLTDYTNQGRQY